MDFCCYERRVTGRIRVLFLRLCGGGWVNFCESNGFNVCAVVCDTKIRVFVIKPTVLLFLRLYTYVLFYSSPVVLRRPWRRWYDL